MYPTKDQLIDGYNRIKERNEELEERIDSEVKLNIELTDIAKEFIERRDKGEIRSTYTYNRFKKALLRL